MAKREERYDEYIGIPVEKHLKEQIMSIAHDEERNPTDMARMLLKKAVAAHLRDKPKRLAAAGK